MPVYQSLTSSTDINYKQNASRPSVPNIIVQQHQSRSWRSLPSFIVSTPQSIISSIISFAENERLYQSSIYGPPNRSKFIFNISMMTICGGNNDFLAKLCYQSIAGGYSWYWIAWLLTASTFFICSFNIICGWNSGKEWNEVKKQKYHFFMNLFIIGTCDVFANLSRYIGLIVLPAPIVTIFKYGLQLIWSTIFRFIFQHKKLSITQSSGIILVIIGLGFVCWCSLLDADDDHSFIKIIIGIAMLFGVGFFGSIKCSFEQILCRDDGLHCCFIIGMRSFVSLFWILLIAILLLLIKTEWNKKEIYDNGIKYVFQYPWFLVNLSLFMLAIYGKNLTQMKIIELSSALTRNLSMQFTPIFTWILSLFVYYVISHSLGEPWTHHSYLRLIGFIIVLIGSYLYMKIPTQNDNQSKILNISNISK